MIETKHTVTTIDGQTIELTHGGQQIWAVRLQWEAVSDSGYASFHNVSGRTFHCTREPLEKAGLLPSTATPKEEPTETVEDLAIRLLEMLGVSFDE